MYAELVAGLSDEAREEVDRHLEVELWGTPVAQQVVVTAARDRHPAAPAWYPGDEAASQAWLAGMGVTLE